MKVTIAQIESQNGAVKENLNKIIEVCNQNKESDMVVFPAGFLTGLNVHQTWGYRLEYLLRLVKSRLDGKVRAGQKVVFGCTALMVDLLDENDSPYHIMTYVDGQVTCTDRKWVQDGYGKDKDTLRVYLHSDCYTESKKVVINWGFAPMVVPVEVDLNPVGGLDTKVYPGGSLIRHKVGGKEEKIANLAYFEDEIYTFDITDISNYKRVTTETSREERMYKALVSSVRSYFNTTGLNGIVLGASGGIDSALVLTIAADAIGGRKVWGISMPSQYSSEHSQVDAQKLMENLGGHFMRIPINKYHSAFSEELGLTGVADENLQARIRGLLVMSIANREGLLVLEPGNKSENALGYSTIYGDTVGGFAPLTDVYKTDVYRLAKWRNRQSPGGKGPIPESSISKEPSAELAPGQVDTDSMPPYGVLDEILKVLLTGVGYADIRGMYGDELVDGVAHKVLQNEWKRRQVAQGPGIGYEQFSGLTDPVTYKYEGREK